MERFLITITSLDEDGNIDLNKERVNITKVKLLQETDASYKVEVKVGKKTISKRYYKKKLLTEENLENEFSDLIIITKDLDKSIDMWNKAINNKIKFFKALEPVVDYKNFLVSDSEKEEYLKMTLDTYPKEFYRFLVKKDSQGKRHVDISKILVTGETEYVYSIAFAIGESNKHWEEVVSKASLITEDCLNKGLFRLELLEQDIDKAVETWNKAMLSYDEVYHELAIDEDTKEKARCLEFVETTPITHLYFIESMPTQPDGSTVRVSKHKIIRETNCTYEINIPSSAGDFKKTIRKSTLLRGGKLSSNYALHVITSVDLADAIKVWNEERDIDVRHYMELANKANKKKISGELEKNILESDADYIWFK